VCDRRHQAFVQGRRPQGVGQVANAGHGVLELGLEHIELRVDLGRVRR